MTVWPMLAYSSGLRCEAIADSFCLFDVVIIQLDFSVGVTENRIELIFINFTI
jgi:hypothetical protein